MLQIDLQSFDKKKCNRATGYGSNIDISVKPYHSRKFFIHLVTRLLYNDCYWYTLFHSNIITQRVKMSYKNIENHKTIAMEHELKNELKNEGHSLKEKKKMIKAVRRSEDPREPVLMWGHSGGRKYQEVCKPDLSPLVERSTAHQPKSGGATMAPTAPTAPTNLVNQSKVNEDVKKVETEMSDKEIEQFERTVKMEWIDSWHPKITKKQIIANIHNRIR